MFYCFSILYYNCIEFIITLYTYLLIRKNILFDGISFSMFSDVLPDFTCASTTRNLLSICLRVNFLRPVLSIVENGNIPLLKALRTFYLPLKCI